MRSWGIVRIGEAPLKINRDCPGPRNVVPRSHARKPIFRASSERLGQHPMAGDGNSATGWVVDRGLDLTSNLTFVEYQWYSRIKNWRKLFCLYGFMVVGVAGWGVDQIDHFTSWLQSYQVSLRLEMLLHFSRLGRSLANLTRLCRYTATNFVHVKAMHCSCKIKMS